MSIKRKTNRLKVFQSLAKEFGITIKKAMPGDATKQGIHRLYPTIHELHDAISEADRDGFKTIYIHNSNTWKVS